MTGDVFEKEMSNCFRISNSSGSVFTLNSFSAQNTGDWKQARNKLVKYG